MNILIVSQPLHNRGDEAAHKALVRTLLATSHDISVKVLCIHEDQDSIDQFNVNNPRAEYINIQGSFGFNYCNIPALINDRRYLWQLHPTHRQILNYYKWADWVLCAPGGICMGGFQNWGHLCCLVRAKLTHKPLAYYGRSFGPFPTESKLNRKFKEISQEMLSYFSFLSIRDSKTEHLAKEMGITNYVKTVDTAFLECPHVGIPSEIRHMIDTNNYMVFVPNLLVWHFAFKSKITKDTVLEFYDRLLDSIFKQDKTMKVVMLPQTYNYERFNGSHENDDIHFMREIAARRNDDRIVVIPDTYSSDIQQTIISGCKFVVGARYHSVVFAINQAVPFIALSYEHKISGLLELLGKQDCMIDIEHGLDSAESINKCVADFKEQQNRLKSDVATSKRAKVIAYGCFNKFIERVKESTHKTK